MYYHIVPKVRLLEVLFSIVLFVTCLRATAYGNVEENTQLWKKMTKIQWKYDIEENPKIPWKKMKKVPWKKFVQENPNETVEELNDRLTKRVTDWGFSLEIHDVITEDGYYLKMHRLLANTENLKSPVLIMHGIKSCSPIFLAYRKSIAYSLAEENYDVWVANARGTAFSKKHKKLKPDEEEFWNFSFHEIGHYDLPAMFRYIKEARETPEVKVHFVGISMGTTSFLVMASTRDSELQADVASVSLISPVACPQHYGRIGTKTKRFILSNIFKAVRKTGKGDIFTYNKNLALALYKICSSEGWKGSLCEKYLRRKSEGKDLFDYDDAIEVAPFYPCGASVKTYLHFIQLATEGKFQQYDYEKDNQFKYDQPSPPEYELGSINKKLYLLVGGEDTVANRMDIQWLENRLKYPVCISKHFEHFDHRDFNVGMDMHIVHNIVVEIIRAYDEQRDPVISP